MTNNSITIRLAPRDVALMDRLIGDGFFTNRSDLVRTSIRHYIAQIQGTPQIVGEMRSEANRKKITKDKIVDKARARRRELYKEMYE